MNLDLMHYYVKTNNENLWPAGPGEVGAPRLPLHTNSRYQMFLSAPAGDIYHFCLLTPNFQCRSIQLN